MAFITADWLAEWSKALVLGTSLFGGVGSNPTPVIFLFSVFFFGVAVLLFLGCEVFKSFASRQKVQLPGIEPGTYRVLGGRHNQLDHSC